MHPTHLGTGAQARRRRVSKRLASMSCNATIILLAHRSLSFMPFPFFFKKLQKDYPSVCLTIITEESNHLHPGGARSRALVTPKPLYKLTCRLIYILAKRVDDLNIRPLTFRKCFVLREDGLQHGMNDAHVSSTGPVTKCDDMSLGFL
jgi:hypothetical protein